MCTFHALLMDAAPIDPFELALTHPGPQRLSVPGPQRMSQRGGPRRVLEATNDAGSERGGFAYDERALRGFVDEADEEVYAAASDRFWADATRTGCTARAQQHVGDHGGHYRASR